MNIHRSRFVPFPHSAVNCLTFLPNDESSSIDNNIDNLRLGVGRGNGNIEIWRQVESQFVQERTFWGGRNRSIESLAWIIDYEKLDDKDTQSGNTHDHSHDHRLRLFSIGYSNAISEWDLQSGIPIRYSAGNNSEIWCFAAQPRSKNGIVDERQDLAVGCADGTVAIYATNENNIRFSRTVARATKRKSRALSIDFHSRLIVAVGYNDCIIRLYNIQTCENLGILSLGGERDESGMRDRLVWTVKCLANGNLVSGDSSGQICIWDVDSLTQIQRLEVHKSDILSVGVSSCGKLIFSCGVDRRVGVCEIETDERGVERFRVKKCEVLHDGDVKALVVHSDLGTNTIVSGGIDSKIVVMKIGEGNNENHRGLCSLPDYSPVRSAPRKRIICSWWNQEVGFWRVNETSKFHNYLETPYQLIGRLLMKDDENISDVAITLDGKYVAVATIATIKLFGFRLVKSSSNKNKLNQTCSEDRLLEVAKLKDAEEFSTFGGRFIQFSPDGRWLGVIGRDNKFYVIQIKHQDMELFRPEASKEKSAKWREISEKICKINILEPLKQHNKGEIVPSFYRDYSRAIHRFSFSPDSQMILFSDLQGYTSTWNLVNESEQNRLKWVNSNTVFPRLEWPAALITFNPRQNTNVMLITMNHNFYEFNTLTGNLTDWSRKNSTTRSEIFRNVQGNAIGCIWDVREKDERFWIWGHSWVYSMDIRNNLWEIDENARSKDRTDKLAVMGKLKRKLDQGRSGTEKIFWRTFKYRSILGIVSLDTVPSKKDAKWIKVIGEKKRKMNSEQRTKVPSRSNETSIDGDKRVLEVVLVECPFELQQT